MIAIKSVDGIQPIIEPEVADISLFDLYADSTGRTAESGVMISKLIRSNIYKIDLVYYGSASEIRAIRELFSLSSSNLSLTVEFLDLGEYITKRMYPSDRVQKSVILKDENTGRYELSFSLTEC